MGNMEKLNIDTDPSTPRKAGIRVGNKNPVYRQLLVAVSLTGTMKKNMEKRKKAHLTEE